MTDEYLVKIPMFRQCTYICIGVVSLFHKRCPAWGEPLPVVRLPRGRCHFNGQEAQCEMAREGGCPTTDINVEWWNLNECAKR